MIISLMVYYKILTIFYNIFYMILILSVLKDVLWRQN